MSGAKADEVEILPPLLRTIKDLELDYELGEITSLAYGKLVNVRVSLRQATSPNSLRAPLLERNQKLLSLR